MELILVRAMKSFNTIGEKVIQILRTLSPNYRICEENKTLLRLKTMTVLKSPKEIVHQLASPNNTVTSLKYDMHYRSPGSTASPRLRDGQVLTRHKSLMKVEPENLREIPESVEVNENLEEEKVAKIEKSYNIKDTEIKLSIEEPQLDTYQMNDIDERSEEGILFHNIHRCQIELSQA